MLGGCERKHTSSCYLGATVLCCTPLKHVKQEGRLQASFLPTSSSCCFAAPVAQPWDSSRDCMDQPELANCGLILQAQLCGNEYYSSFCCASCSRFQPHAQPIWQQG